MAGELAPHGIQVNALAPGWIATELTAMARDDPDWAAFNSLLMTRTPAGRWGEPTNAPARRFSGEPGGGFRDRGHPAGRWRLFGFLTRAVCAGAIPP